MDLGRRRGAVALRAGTLDPLVISIIAMGALTAILAGLIVTRFRIVHVNVLFLTLLVFLYALAIRRSNGRWDLADLRVWFAGFFLLYGIAEPLTGINVLGTARPEIFSDSLIAASHLYVLGAVGLLASVVFLRKSGTSQQRLEGYPQPKMYALRVVSIAGIGLGLVLLYLNYSKLPGSLLQVIGMVRGFRKDMIYETGGIAWPYDTVLIISIGAYLLTLLQWPRRQGKTAWFFFLGILAAVAGFWILIGERSELISLGLFLIAILSTKIPVCLTKRRMLAMVLVLLVLVASGTLRNSLPRALVTGDMNAVVASVQDTLSFKTVRNALASFANPYVTLITSTYESENPPRAGWTYLQSIPNLVPRFLYPGEKPLTIGWEFSQNYTSFWRPGHPRNMGFGFMPITEAYVNFGWFGPPLIMFLLGLIMNAIYRRKSSRNSIIYTLAYAVLMTQAFNINRTSFAAVGIILFRSAVGVLALLAAASVLDIVTTHLRGTTTPHPPVEGAGYTE